MEKRIVSLVTALGILLLAVPAFALRGVVVDNKGQPIAKAKVFIIRDSEIIGPVAYTDKSGRFEWLPDDSESNGKPVAILVAANRMAYGKVHLSPDQQQPLKIVLQPEKKFEAVVVDENGDPIEGAKVTVEWFHASSQLEEHNALAGFGRPSTLPRPITTSGADGRFTILHLPDPEYLDLLSIVVEITKDGRALVTYQLDEWEWPDEAVIELPPACSLEGVVRLPDGETPAPEGMTLSVKIYDPPDMRDVKLGPDGVFSLDKLPPGKVDIMLSKYHDSGSWVMPSVVGLELTPAESKKLDLMLERGVELVCTAVDKATGELFTAAGLYLRHSGSPRSEPVSFRQRRLDDGSKEYYALAAPGDVAITASHIVMQNASIRLHPDDQPVLRLKIEPGETVRKAVIEIDVSESGYNADIIQPKDETDLELLPGEYILHWDESVNCRGFTSSRTAIVPGRTGNLPEFVTDIPKLYDFQLDGDDDDELLLVALDKTQETEVRYDTVYIDSNRNRDLTDDKPVNFRPQEPWRNSYLTDWVKVNAHQGLSGPNQTNHPVYVRVKVYTYGGDVSVSLERKGAWKGVIGTSQGDIQCLAVDYNANGVYNDLITMINEPGAEPCYNPGDQLNVDITGMGVVLCYFTGDQIIRLQGVNLINGKPYELRVSDVGDILTVSKYTGSMGKILVKCTDIEGVDGSVIRAAVIGEKGFFVLDSYDGKSYDLPGGTYTFYSCTLKLNTPNTLTVLECNTALTAEVYGGEEAVFDISGPISAEINPDKENLYLVSGRSEDVDWVIKIGDEITVGQWSSHAEDTRPKVKFFDQNGKLVHMSDVGYT